MRTDHETNSPSTRNGILQQTSQRKRHDSEPGYLVESFALCSADKDVNKKGKGKRPDTSYTKGYPKKAQCAFEQITGRKISDSDLSIASVYFEKYVQLVNIIIQRVWANPKLFHTLGKKLHSKWGPGYVLLRKVKELSYKDNEVISNHCFERQHRNALEQASRIILSAWLRHNLMQSAISFIKEDSNILESILKNKYISPKIVREVRFQCKTTPKNGSGYYHTVSVLKQLRRALDERILDMRGESLGSRGSQRIRVRKYLKDKAEAGKIIAYSETVLRQFEVNGYPLPIPTMLSYTEEFSASTENYPGQGYWYSIDKERESEILLFVKLPEPIEGVEREGSPYSTNTLTFRFLNWLPRAAKKSKSKAKKAELEGKYHCARKHHFNALKFHDMHQQLMNTIALQHTTYQYTLLRYRRNKDTTRMKELEERIANLQATRRCRPPRLLLRSNKVILQIPFFSLTKEIMDEKLGLLTYNRQAGADRGIRIPIVVSVRIGEGKYSDKLIAFDELMTKRKLLRKQAIQLTSRIKRMQNNWERKHSNNNYPRHILKKERLLSAIWSKIRRLNNEIALQAASATIWFCEEHGVKTLYFENLKNYSSPRNWGQLSWGLSTNLWGKMLDNVRYMRQQLGHNHASVWSVNPKNTSKFCHQCGNPGIRVQDASSTVERKGGEFFYCSTCGNHFQADINAARNIIKLQDSSVVPGRMGNSCLNHPAKNERPPSGYVNDSDN